MADNKDENQEKELEEEEKGDDYSSDSSDNDDSSKPTIRGSPLTPIEWIRYQMEKGVRPENVLKQLVGSSFQKPQGMDDISLWEAVLELILRPPIREPLSDVTSLNDVVRLINNSNKIIVLSGAGISVSCGIPDFRSPEGLYATLAVRFPELPDPQAMFDINFFRIDPRPFFSFVKEIFPGKYQPSISHKFIKALEKNGKLLRNYTQNIDTLENTTGIERVVYCHGSFSTATCCKCKHRVDIEIIKEDIMKERIPYCTQCEEKANSEDESEGEMNNIMKPDIVFFGEGLPKDFHEQLNSDKLEADLLIVMGSSLKVRPVSLIPDVLPDNIPRVLINREPLQYIPGFDVRLLGYSNTIITELCRKLGPDWLEAVEITEPIQEVTVTSPYTRVHLFDGAIWNTPPSSPSSSSSSSSLSAVEHPSSTAVEHSSIEHPSSTAVEHPSLEYPSLAAVEHSSIEHPSLTAVEHSLLEHPSIQHPSLTGVEHHTDTNILKRPSTDSHNNSTPVKVSKLIDTVDYDDDT